jgi:hypothetical protein
MVLPDPSPGDENPLLFYSSTEEFFEPTSSTTLDLPSIKVMVKTPKFRSVCSVTISDLQLFSDSNTQKDSASTKLTVDRVSFRDMINGENIGSIDDFRFLLENSKGDELCSPKLTR